MAKLYKKFRLISPLVWLLILLSISFLFRINRLSTPSSYIFDEVYHVVTSRAYSQNNPEAYNPFSKAPEPNTAFDWLHPPLAKLIQASSIKLIGDKSFAWRFPSAIFGTLSIAALYYFALTLFKNQKLALLAATIFSLDGLQLTMSRITMNDIFVTTFIILSLAFFYKVTGSELQSTVKPGRPQIKSRASSEPSAYRKSLFLTGLFTGLALATKWSALFLFPIYTIFLTRSVLVEWQGRTLLDSIKKITIFFIYLLIVPVLIYFLSYTQYFLLGYTLKNFYELHQQIFWYQTGLTATHGYQSAAWQWPLLLKPVWFHVKYTTNHIANIYNLGNPAIFWGGLIAVFRFVGSELQLRSVLAKRQGRTLLYCLKKISIFFLSRPNAPLFLLLSYLLLFLPWLSSPRILFFHHYLPALPFLCLIIAKTIYPFKSLTFNYLLITIFLFLFFYPLNTAIPLQSDLTKFWFWLPSWK